MFSGLASISMVLDRPSLSVDCRNSTVRREIFSKNQKEKFFRQSIRFAFRLFPQFFSSVFHCVLTISNEWYVKTQKLTKQLISYFLPVAVAVFVGLAAAGLPAFFFGWVRFVRFRAGVNDVSPLKYLLTFFKRYSIVHELFWPMTGRAAARWTVLFVPTALALPALTKFFRATRLWCLVNFKLRTYFGSTWFQFSANKCFRCFHHVEMQLTPVNEVNRCDWGRLIPLRWSFRSEMKKTWKPSVGSTIETDSGCDWYGSCF